MSKTTLPRAFLAPRYWLLWLGLGLIYLLSLLPWRLRHLLGRGLAALAWRFNHKRREVVLTNLAQCFPAQSAAQREALAQRHFRLLGCSIVDISLMWFGSDARLAEMVDVEGWPQVEAARAAGHNVIFHVAHSHGLEFGAVAVASRHSGIGFYKPAKNPLVNWLVLRSRERFGNLLVSRDEGVRHYIKALRGGRVLYLLSDEDLGTENAEFVPFFAATKATLFAPARLATLGRAVVVPAMTFVDSDTGRYTLVLGEPLTDLPRATPRDDAAALNHSLERLIARDPAQYMWFLKLLRTQPDGRDLYRRD